MSCKSFHLIVLALLAGCGFQAHPPPVVFNVRPLATSVPEGRRMVMLMCASCHYDPGTKRLTGSAMEDLPAFLGRVYSRNITRHAEKGIASYTDRELAVLLRTGVARDGTLMPYMQKPLLADEDLEAVIAFLRSDEELVAASDVEPPPTSYTLLGKLAMRIFSPPLPYPEKRIPRPDPSDEETTGRYLTANLGCYECHSASLTGLDPAEPENSKGFLAGGTALVGTGGEPIISPNLTFHDTGLAAWSEDDFICALKTGIGNDDSPLRYPMPRYVELEDQEARAIFRYLETVPRMEGGREAKTASRSMVQSSDTAESSTEGRDHYEGYGCVSCHGDAGTEMVDLGAATTKYSDDRLIAYIEDPGAFGNRRMPAFSGIIAEEDYPVLIAYVRSLGEERIKR